MRRTLLALAALLAAGAALAQNLPQRPPPQSPPQSAAEEPPVAEIEVSGERPGPSLWKVSRGDHVVWLLGTLDPLPRRMTWRSLEVERVIAQAQEVLPSVPSVNARIGPILAIRLYMQWRHTEKIPDGQTLRDWLTPQLYARLLQLESRYDRHDRKLESMRPIFAAWRLYDRAIDASGLTSHNDIQDTVLALARKHRVRVDKMPLRVEDPRAILAAVNEIPRAAEIDCLAATVDRLETDVGAMQQRARAWALGDVNALRALPYARQRQTCWDAVTRAPALKALADRAAAEWDSALQRALTNNRSTLALKPIYDLIAPDGVLAQLRSRGYTVEGP